MTGTRDSSELRRVVVCEVDATAGAGETVQSALAYCREHNTELIAVWTVEPGPLAPTFPATGAGAIGTWGLVGAVALALEPARCAGVPATAVVRFGERRAVVEEVCAAFGAERVFTRADVPVIRCPLCSSRYDARAVHFCPTVHLPRRQAA